MKLFELSAHDQTILFSPHCWKIRLALLHKGIDFASVPTGFTAIGVSTPGPSKTLPILADGDTVLHDSFAIADYLDQAYPDPPALFPDAASRSLARVVEGWANSTVHPLISRIALVNIHRMIGPADQTYFRESREARFKTTLEDLVSNAVAERAALVRQMTPVRKLLSEQPFLGGADPAFADFILMGSLQWLRVTSGAAVFPAGDPVGIWWERAAVLYDGAVTAMPAAA